MNIFKKALLIALSAGLLSVPSTLDKVEAAAGVDDSKEKWSLIGTVNGTSWNTDFELAYDATDDRYEIVATLAVGNEFKVRLNKAWTTSIGYGGNTGSGISTYLSNSGGNFKVKTAGTYCLWVKDDNVAKYGDKSYGFGIEEYVAQEYTVNFVTNTDEVIDSITVLGGNTFELPTPEVNGYPFLGWYTDSALNTPYVADKVNSDLTLYAKWGEYNGVADHGNTRIFFKNTENWTKVNVWYWGGTSVQEDAWPGTAMTQFEDTEYYYIDVNATSVLFNNGTVQTVDVAVSGSTVYQLDGTKNGDKYNVVTASSTYLEPYFQKQANGEVNDVRFIATLGDGTGTFNLENYEEVGFIVFDSTDLTKKTTKSTTRVYTSVTANGSEVNATDLEADFFFAIVVSGVPAGQSFFVLPYAKTLTGTYEFGAAKTFVVL